MDSDSDDNLIDEDEIERNLPHRQFSFTRSRPSVRKEGRTKYRDYHSIDWLRETSKDKKRQILIEQDRKSGRFYDKSYSIFDKCSGWIVVLLIGIAAGCAAGLVDITTKWLSDLKLGLCYKSIFFNREQCCWDSKNPKIEDCESWRTWNQLFHVDSSGGSYVINYLFYVGLSVLFGSLCVTITYYFSPYAIGSGIPEVKTILSGFIIHGYLGIGSLIGKTISLPLAVGAGLSLGKEGPLVHVASCCGNAIARLFPKYAANEAKKREMLSAASAAGVSVAFGAPIGGVLFALEEVSYYFPLKTLYRSFLCALTAAFVLRSINPFGTEHLVMFYSQYDQPWFYFELIGFVIVGILGGLYGALFNKLNLLYCNFRRNSKLAAYPITEVIVTVLATSLLCFPNQYSRMPQPSLIHMLFKTCKLDAYDQDLCHYEMPENATSIPAYQDMIVGYLTPEIWSAIWKLVLTMVLYTALTVITFGIKVPSGLFIPTMTTGAIFGRLTGLAIQQIVYMHKGSILWSDYCSEGQVCVNPGLYAMVGAAATLSGVTRMTVSLVVIMYELTGGLLYIVPLMVATMIAKWVADAFDEHGIYDKHIILNNYPFLDCKTEYRYSTLACDVMRPRPEEPNSSFCVLTGEGMSIQEIDDILKRNSYNGFPVVVSRQCMRLIGYVEATELTEAINESRRKPGITSLSKVHFTDYVPLQQAGDPLICRLNHILDIAPMNITDVSSMSLVVEIFRKLGIRQCLVLRHGKLIGIITRKDILYHILRLSQQNPENN